MILLQMTHLMDERGEGVGRRASPKPIGVQGDFIGDDFACGVRPGVAMEGLRCQRRHPCGIEQEDSSPRPTRSGHREEGV
jgi:hypothetical protein